MKKVKSSSVSGRDERSHRALTQPIPFCVKCKSTSIAFKVIENSKCSCGAPFHFKKTCLSCGSVTMIHRAVINDGRKNPEDFLCSENPEDFHNERRYFFGVKK